MTVFVLKDPQTLVAMQPADFASEDHFQALLADFPSLLSGDQGDGTSARRWMLIKREKSVAAQEGGAGRWSVDHLFVDQDGVPTLVEVKRQTDTRIRREVVGQMLDYAALWERMSTNLQAGRIRMLFVADRIPPELRRIVEFLNRQMSPAEVLALELRQFEGEGLKTIVPVLYGQTEDAQSRKEVGGPKRQWDQETFFADFGERNTPEACQTAEKIFSWMRQNGDQIVFGRGAKDGSVSIMVMGGGQKNYPMSIWTYGRIEIEFQYLIRGSFAPEDKRRELLRRLNDIEGIALPRDSITRRPTIPITTFSSDVRLKAFLKVMDWLLGEIGHTPKAGTAASAF